MYKNKHHNTQSRTYKSIVRNIKLSGVRPNRAGVILYYINNGRLYIGMGVDSKTHDLTDFAGNILYCTIDNNCIDGALREFQEETLSIFKPIKKNDILDCPVIYNKHNLIIFMRTDIEPNIISEKFNTKYRKLAAQMKNSNDIEVCGITWLEWSDFIYSIHNDDIIYSRVKNFIKSTNTLQNIL